MPSAPPIVAESQVQEKKPLKGAEERVQEAQAAEAATGAKGTKKMKAEGPQGVPVQAEPAAEVKEAAPVSREEKRVVPPPVHSREAEKRIETKKEGPVPRIQEPEDTAPQSPGN